jgi:hypothetical protein
MITTEDGKDINPETEQVYFYPDSSSDGVPCWGLMNFDNEERIWKTYLGGTSPVFATRIGINNYIESRKK